MKIFYRNKNEDVNFNKNDIPNASLDSDIYVVSNFLFFKSNNELQVYKFNSLVYHVKYNDSLSHVFYNNDLKMLAIMNSESNLELLLEIEEGKIRNRTKNCSKVIIDNYFKQHVYYYKSTNKFEILYNRNKYIFESFAHFENVQEAVKVEIKSFKEPVNDDKFICNLLTNFDYQIAYKNHDNILYHIDKKGNAVGNPQIHDGEIKDYSINLKRNLLATISTANTIYVWKMNKEGLQFWITKETSPGLIHTDIGFSEKGKCVGVITKSNEINPTLTLTVFEIIMKKTKKQKNREHVLAKLEPTETKFNKVMISDLGVELKDGKPEIKTPVNKENLKNKTECKPPVINKQEPAETVKRVIKDTGSKQQKPKLQKDFKDREIKENETGHSFESLFADYLKDATKIVITDPYIKAPHQYRNLEKLIKVVVKLKREYENVMIHLITSEADDNPTSQNEFLRKIEDTYAYKGIDFSWEFDNMIHDRRVLLDNGWKIILGRGLDIFKPDEKKLQQPRKCWGFWVTYLWEQEK